MKLLLVKSGGDVLIGRSLSAEVSHELEHPMRVEFHQQAIASKVAGAPPQVVTGFRFVPIPVTKIFLNEVSWAGEISITDPMCELYSRVLEAQKEAAKSPLMVSQ